MPCRPMTCHAMPCHGTASRLVCCQEVKFRGIEWCLLCGGPGIKQTPFEGVSLSRLMAILGPSWRHCGPLLALPWALIRPSWALLGPLEPSWTDRKVLRAILEPSLAHLGPILGRSLPILGHLEAVLGQCWGILGPCSGHLGPSWATLGPSWGQKLSRTSNVSSNIRMYNNYTFP